MDLNGKVDAEQEDQYISEEDEDFNPTNVEAQDNELSESSEDEAAPDAPPKRRKATKKRKHTQAGLDEELDSGDEATIRGLKKRKRRNGEDDPEDQDSGGEGGLVKTRAQRKAEKQQKAEFRAAVDQGHVTVDVDDLWAKLSSAPIGRRPPEPIRLKETVSADGDPVHDDDDGAANASAADNDDDEIITIKRSYAFAGQTITEEKRVHKSSAEAKLYLATHSAAKDSTKPPSPDPVTGAGDGLQLRRPLRRASRFEPNPTGEVRGLPLERQRLRAPTRADVLAQKQRQEEEDKRRGKVQKLNTVQKSAMDWAAHVDREGFKEELDVYGRSRQGFLGRMDFMRGVEGRKEEEERNARLATSAAAISTASM